MAALTLLFAEVQVPLEVTRNTLDLPSTLPANKDLACDLVLRHPTLEDPSTVDELIKWDGSMGLRLVDDRSLLGNFTNRNLGVKVRLLDNCNGGKTPTRVTPEKFAHRSSR